MERGASSIRSPSAPGADAALPRPGDVIAGKFQVEEILGRGGMGVVVAARHLILRQRVAVKFLLPHALQVPDAAERFLREARAAVAIQGEHVARVIDVGTLESGAPYIVMEFLAGTDLNRVVKQRGALPIPDAVDYVLQACEAIAEAHALGIVHRDLKPANLFLTARAEGSPLVKVLDFGLSKSGLGDDGLPEASLTATGFVMGSPQYMSPEQVRSLKHVDWRTDIWALGVILYELLTGRRPFDGPSLTAVSAAIVADVPPSPRRIRGDLPAALEAALMACLEKDPARRTPSVAVLAQALAPFAPQRSWTSVDRIQRFIPERASTIQRPSLPHPPPPPVPAVASGPSPASGQLPAAGVAPALPTSIPTVEADADPTTAYPSAWGQARSVSGPLPAPRRTPVAAIVAGAAMVILGALGGVAAWVLRAPAPPAPSSPAPAQPAKSAPAPVEAAAPAPVETASAAPAETAAAAAPTATARPDARAKPRAVATAKPAAKRVNPLDRAD